MTEEVAKLGKKKGGLKKSLTEFAKYVKGISRETAEGEVGRRKMIELEMRLQRVNPILDKFLAMQVQISEITGESEALDAESETFQCSYFEVIAEAKELLENLEDKASRADSVVSAPQNVFVAPQATSHVVSASVKLPTICMPTFDGKYTKWCEFKDTYTALIHDESSLSDIQKFYYLRSSLEGDAAQIIASMEISAANYAAAWASVCERYDNTRVLVQSHIQALFNMENITREAAGGLRDILDAVNQHLRALKSLGQPTEAWDSLIIFIITNKLDSNTLREWESHKTKEVLPDLNEMREFLRNKATVLETLNSKATNERKLGKPINKAKAFAVAQMMCYFCKGNHSVYGCTTLRQLAVGERTKQCKELKLCLNCLRPGHNAHACTQQGCKKCNHKHNSILHSGKRGDSSGNENFAGAALTASGRDPRLCLLSTARANIYNESGQMVRGRLLLDSGSQCNLIQESFANKLNLKITSINLRLSGIANVEAGCTGTCIVKIRSRYEPYSTDISCVVVPEISGLIPQTRFKAKGVNIPPSMELADPSFGEPGEINILLGAAIFWQILKRERVSLHNRQLIAQETKLGWILAGQVSAASTVNSFHSCLQKEGEKRDLIERFWEIEEVAIGKLPSPDERFCEDHFLDNHRRDRSGRFVVSIPFIKSTTVLGDSEVTARRRFLNLERKLQNNSVLRRQYVNFMKEYEALGHMSRVNAGEKLAVQYFIPHHSVVNEASKTTQLRVVFDASCRTTSGFSLNDLQAVGPVIQSDLFDILIRFREHYVAFSADITKMYRQVLVEPSERALQQIFWREDPKEKLNSFYLNTVTYGTAAASFLAIRCLKQLAEENMEKFPEAAAAILDSFYVDDCLAGAENEKDAERLMQEIAGILETGCFSLRKWVSNKPEIFEGLPSDSEFKVLNLDEKENIKTLGLFWAPGDDCFQFKFAGKESTKAITKRVFLSEIGKIFDPLGLVGAIIIRAKLMMQEIWQAGLDWDAELPSKMRERWINFQRDLAAVSLLKIPRYVALRGAVQFQLHGFGDASEKAYGACIYLRCVSAGNGIKVTLLAAKSRVAPLKTQTVPRLELCAAVLLAKLTKKVRMALKIVVERVTLWSDSQVVLGWLQTAPHLLKIFIANRVMQIQESMKAVIWRYVPSRENPADLISRGMSAADLRNAEMWWSGPQFLRNSEATWPSIIQGCPKNLPEMRPEKFVVLKATEQATIEQGLYRFSNYTRLKRAFSYVLRFVHNCRAKRCGTDKLAGYLNPTEIINAEIKLFKIIQGVVYKSELKFLEKGEQVPKCSRLRALAPFLDEAGLIRVGGRLKHSHLDFSERHPIILPEKGRFVYLLFRNEHLRLGHAGPSQTLFSVRERIWPVRGRNIAKRVVRECVACFRASPKNTVPIMGQLPTVRTKPGHTFQNVGVDYAGPFLIKKFKGRGAKSLKCYMAIFVCLVTKACHIEIVTELTTDAFIACLKRFIARRGKPVCLMSDNGTNFSGADRELKSIINELQANEEKIGTMLVNEGINWRFIPPSAPHFGGLWEAMVKRAKFHLKRILGGNASFTYEEFATLSCQVEAIMNSRPLCPMSPHAEDLEPLTPGHFLIGRTLTALPEHDVRDVSVNRLTHFQNIQRLVQHFWLRWTKEYLPTLQVRQKWQKTANNIQINDLVLVKDENYPPLVWPLARVVELHPDPSGTCRVATIRTVRGLLKRPVVKLFLLPTRANNESCTDSEAGAVQVFDV